MIFCKIKEFYNKTNSKNKEIMLSNLLREEFGEWDKENTYFDENFKEHFNKSAESELKEICDLIFVAVQRGYQITGDPIDFEIALNKICISNLQKLKKPKYHPRTGKLLKNKDYKAPELWRYIR
jgi:hypothetical protein